MAEHYPLGVYKVRIWKYDMQQIIISGFGGQEFFHGKAAGSRRSS